MSKTRTNQPIYTEDLSSELTFPSPVQKDEVMVKELGDIIFVHLYLKTTTPIDAGVAIAKLPKPKHAHVQWSNTSAGLYSFQLLTTGNLICTSANLATNIYVDISFFYERA